MVLVNNKLKPFFKITNSKEISMIYFCSQYVLLLLIESAALLHSDGSTNKTKMLDDPVTAGSVELGEAGVKSPPPSSADLARRHLQNSIMIMYQNFAPFRNGDNPIIKSIIKTEVTIFTDLEQNPSICCTEQIKSSVS